MSNRPDFLNPVTSVLILSAAMLSGCSDSQGLANATTASPSAASTAVSYPQGDFRSPITFSNPYAHIPAQCHIETSRGTQNACLFCHTDYLAKEKHGNAFPLGEDQILYSFPTPDLNKVLWRNTIFPEEILARLKKEGVPLPKPGDVGYVHDVEPAV